MKRILIVEDEPLVAQVMEMTFQNHDFEVLPIAMTVSEAVSVLDDGLLDVALLDINLGDENTFEVAKRLMSLRIPFAFYTAYHDSRLPAEFHGIPVISKTAPRKRIVEAVNALISRPA